MIEYALNNIIIMFSFILSNVPLYRGTLFNKTITYLDYKLTEAKMYQLYKKI